MTGFAERVKKELEFKGMRISELAHALNLADSTVRGWFVKDCMPVADTAYECAKLLDVSLEYLITGTAERKTETVVPVDNYTQEEKKIIDDYRKLDQRDREDVRDLLKVKCARYASVRNYVVGG